MVEVPEKSFDGLHSEEVKQNESRFLDWLNEGSCFCVYSGFSKEMYQMVNYRASTTCIVESILVKDLKALEKNNIQLSDILKQMEIDILNGEKSDLDFFRFKPQRTGEMPPNVKKLIRKKFRDAAMKYCKQVRSGKLNELPALTALRKFQEERSLQRKKLDELKFSSNMNQKKNPISEFLNTKPVDKSTFTNQDKIVIDAHDDFA